MRALGATIEVPCIDGSKVKVKIPAGTQYGKQLRLKGKRNAYFTKKFLWGFIY
jgi:DnaJ-class molecular chaperone